MTRKPYRRHNSPPTHGFLPSVTLFWPHYCRQGAKSATGHFGPTLRAAAVRTACANSSTIRINPKNQMLIDIQASGAAGAPAPAPLAAEAEIDAPTGVNWPAGAGRPGCRAGPPRRGYAQAPAVHAGPARAVPRAWRTRTPVPDAGPDAALDAPLAVARPFAGSRSGTRMRHGRHLRRRPGGIESASSSSCSRRPRPTAASRCSSDVRRFSGCSSGSSPRRARSSFWAGTGSSSMRGMRMLRDGIRSGCGGMNASGSRALGSADRRIDEQRRLRPERPDRHLRALRQDGRGDGGLGRIRSNR